jgi:hypothetical protein
MDRKLNLDVRGLDSAHPSFASKLKAGKPNFEVTPAISDVENEERTILIAQVATISKFLIEHMRMGIGDKTGRATTAGDIDEKALRNLQQARYTCVVAAFSVLIAEYRYGRCGAAVWSL